jgi:hypothetical protein
LYTYYLKPGKTSATEVQKIPGGKIEFEVMIFLGAVVIAM